jgi:DNA-binding NtrC family response regulator
MKNQGNLLIVDDNKSVLSALHLFLKHKFNEVIICNNPNQIPSLVSKYCFDLVLLDMNFTTGVNNGNEGIYWLQELLRIDSKLVVILFTAYGDIDLAVNAMKYGATDFILKPWDNKKLLATLRSGVELYQTRQKVDQLEDQKKFLEQDLNHSFQGMIGDSDAMKPVFAMIDKVAKTDANVLILGENGTGKELVARELHFKSNRHKEIFMGVDLGALSESIFESELFGHVKGAFTDAKEDRKGRFQSASGGSLFFDEIGNISLAMQAKLLAAVQNRRVTPLGSNKEDQVDIRLICASNQNITKMVKEGKFREDLLYRINTIQIELPPLRDREEDILKIANHFLQRYADKYEKVFGSLSKEVNEKLLVYSWPGNIRELRHCMERVAIMNEKYDLVPADFILESKNASVELGNKPISLDDAEKVLIQNALKRLKGNVSKVAEELKIGRQTLYRKIEKYKIF